jgi:hypothetical protein
MFSKNELMERIDRYIIYLCLYTMEVYHRGSPNSIKERSVPRPKQIDAALAILNS